MVSRSGTAISFTCIVRLMADQTGDEPAGNAAPPPPVDPLAAGRLAGRLTGGQLALLRKHAGLPAMSYS